MHDGSAMGSPSVKISKWLPLIGGSAILLCGLTWMIDGLDLVFPCPYCRVQRTAIGLLGLILLLPSRGHWLSLYAGSAISFFGLNAASTQHFVGWAKLMDGSFELGSPWYFDDWLLSGAAILIMTALWLLVWNQRLMRGHADIAAQDCR